MNGKLRNGGLCNLGCVHLEMYSSGRRGAPAKGVGRDNRRGGSNPLISAKTKRQVLCLSFCFADVVLFSAALCGFAANVVHKRGEGRRLLASERPDADVFPWKNPPLISAFSLLLSDRSCACLFVLLMQCCFCLLKPSTHLRIFANFYMTDLVPVFLFCRCCTC